MRYKPLILVVFLLAAAVASATWHFDVESGMVFNGYNDVRIPGVGGDDFSLKDDLPLDNTPYFRVRAGYILNDRHYVGILVAPLRLEGSGMFDRDIIFNGAEFPAGSIVESEYRFDSYRVTYRYNLLRYPDFVFGLGATVKLRDAVITLSGDRTNSSKLNTGLVPLINFALNWDFINGFSLIFEGDALAAPQGRAEDVFLGMGYRINPNMTLKGGYRVLEGGADVDEVYTFAMLHYAALGVLIEF